MIKQKLQNFTARHRCTLLGIGPMSVNCVDATIELANRHDIPLMLIASRRQIDSAEFGGGYVNNWTTSEFAEYVIDHDKKGRIILARDHGGPWQSEKETASQMSLRRAMESAKLSYRADIDAGFQILHIDPSVDMHAKPGAEEIIERICELYEYCWCYAQKTGKEIIFEVGTEEQSGSTNAIEDLEYSLSHIQRFCHKEKIPPPSFVVIQTGTRVKEMRNVGSFDSPIRVAGEVALEIHLPKVIEVCKRFDVFIKEHNADYLSDESLQWHPRFGIHSANVAPEFGVAETKALLHLLEENHLHDLAARFSDTVLASRKWEKWLLPDSTASNRERVEIAGHYLFAHPDVIEVKHAARKHMKEKGIDLDLYLKERVKASIMRYLTNFRMVKQ
ncbi:MAG: tagatose-6-phosphate kinase [Geobacter sp.]|nr:MAG: tagatose-6-phosphate kinase [Geobacter sp.]